MDVRSDIFPGTPDGFHPRDVSVRLARPDERIRWDRLMDQHHYLGFKRFAGRGVRYVFDWRGQWVGLAGWQSGAFKCRPRDQWIGWKRELQFTRMHHRLTSTTILSQENQQIRTRPRNLAQVPRILAQVPRISCSSVPGFCRLDAVGANERLCPRERSIYGPARGSEGLTCFSAAPRYQKSYVCPGSSSRPLAAEPDGGRLRAAASRFELCL